MFILSLACMPYIHLSFGQCATYILVDSQLLSTCIYFYDSAPYWLSLSISNTVSELLQPNQTIQHLNIKLISETRDNASFDNCNTTKNVKKHHPAYCSTYRYCLPTRRNQGWVGPVPNRGPNDYPRFGPDRKPKIQISVRLGP